MGNQGQRDEDDDLDDEDLDDDEELDDDDDEAPEVEGPIVLRATVLCPIEGNRKWLLEPVDEADGANIAFDAYDPKNNDRRGYDLIAAWCEKNLKKGEKTKFTWISPEQGDGSPCALMIEEL